MAQNVKTDPNRFEITIWLGQSTSIHGLTHSTIRRISLSPPCPASSTSANAAAVRWAREVFQTHGIHGIPMGYMKNHGKIMGKPPSLETSSWENRELNDGSSSELAKFRQVSGLSENISAQPIPNNHTLICSRCFSTFPVVQSTVSASY